MEIKQIEISKIKPNSYNPNRMTEEKYKELVEEIKHLGRIPKPLIIDTNYIIIDGEHTYKASKELKLKEAPCEIVEVDDFEKRRLTYKYNQHGEHDPVLLGTMFKQMIDLKKISQLELSKQINISEGTIRNMLLFLEAKEEIRNGYELNKLTVRQIRQWKKLFNKINSRFANLWLKKGAKRDDLIDCIKYYFKINKIKQVEESIAGYENTKDTGLEDLVIDNLAGINKVCWPAVEEYEWFGNLYCQIIDNESFLKKVIKEILGPIWTRSDEKIEMVGEYCALYFEKVWPLINEYWFIETLEFLLTEKEEFLLTAEELKEVAKEAEEFTRDSKKGMSFGDFKEDFIVRRIKKKYGKYEKKSYLDVKNDIYRNKLEEAPEYIKKADYKFRWNDQEDLEAIYKLWKMDLHEDVKKIVAEVGLKPGDFKWDMKIARIEKRLQGEALLKHFNSMTTEKTVEELYKFMQDLCASYKLTDEEKLYLDNEFKKDISKIIDDCKIGKVLAYSLYTIANNENRIREFKEQFAEIGQI